MRTYDNIVGSNSLHVITMRSTTFSPIESSTIIDGFVVVGGAASYALDSEDRNGGGIRCTGDGECSPVLNNMLFIGNKGESGAAIEVSSSVVNLEMSNSILKGNYANEYGGAIELNYERGYPAFDKCAFLNNGADLNGGAVVDEGAAAVQNSTFFDNRAADGGAIFVVGPNFVGQLTIKNSTFVENTATGSGGAIFNNAAYADPSGRGSISATNSIFWGNVASESQDIKNYGLAISFLYRDVLRQGCPDAVSSCRNITRLDPALGIAADHGGSTITLVPGPDGSAIDLGDDLSCTRTDQRGILRPQGAHCDIGAVEWQPSDDIIFRNGFQ